MARQWLVCRRGTVSVRCGRSRRPGSARPIRRVWVAVRRCTSPAGRSCRPLPRWRRRRDDGVRPGPLDDRPVGHRADRGVAGQRQHRTGRGTSRGPRRRQRRPRRSCRSPVLRMRRARSSTTRGICSVSAATRRTSRHSSTTCRMVRRRSALRTSRPRSSGLVRPPAR
jgi:hypothetical protein